jgi:hypothetical protein
VPAQLLRHLKPDEVQCPAGELVREADINCKIEDNVLVGVENPDTVAGFCCGEYAECRSWQTAREIERRGGDLQKIMASRRDEASRHRARKMLREARLRRQQELLHSNTPEGRRFRERVARVMALAEMRMAAERERTAA